MMVPTFDDPALLAANIGHHQVVAATFVPDPEGDYEIDEERCRAVYFPVRKDATREQMEAICFEIRNGKPMDDYQRWALAEAKSGA